MKQLWVMIAGPYRTGTRTESERVENLRALNRTAYEVLLRGHVPIVGVNLALPIIEAAGTDQYEQIMTPLSLAAADRCDAVLRVGGPSAGADQEVDRVCSHGGLAYHNVEDLPTLGSQARRVPPGT